MKFLSSQLGYLFSQPETRRNLHAFFRFIALLGVLIALFSVLFHVIMARFEGEEHSWLTGLYWTLTVMTTLGFGDITFHTDIGRAFSILVLLSGMVLLIIVLPFTFIRYFYAPWLEAQIRLQAPREVPNTTTGHVLICRWDDLARGLAERLKTLNIAYHVIEPDPTIAATLVAQGVSVVTGEVDARETYTKLAARGARLVLANLSDAANTNVTLTVREETSETPIAAIVEDEESVDILELSGATYAIALKDSLGDKLASRVSAGVQSAHVLGRYRNLVIAELTIHRTRYANVTVRDTQLRRQTGLNLVGVWQRGRLVPPTPDLVLTPYSVAVVCGSDAQLAKLNDLLDDDPPQEHPVIVIGGGRVGQAVARALKARGIRVCLIEENRALEPKLAPLADSVIYGNAADRKVMLQAGIEQAPSVVLTTNDDAINIYLAVYCRKLSPSLHIISRVTHERNIEAVHRAGADFVLSYTALGIKQMMAIVQGRELVVLAEGVDLFVLDVPKSLSGTTLADAQIGARTGLTIIGIQKGASVEVVDATHPLEENTQLVAIGTTQSRGQYVTTFGVQ